MANTKCEGCDLYKDGFCTKWRENGKTDVSTIDWLKRESYEGPLSFISVDRMCRNSSIFGNEYIGLTQADIDRITNGEIIHIPGEYGTFIGFLNDADKNATNDYLNGNKIWVSQDVYERIKNNPDGVCIEAVGKPIIVLK